MIVLDPRKMRVAIQGDILGLQKPLSVLARSFLQVGEALPLEPLSTSQQTLTTLGKNPSKKVHTFVYHTERSTNIATVCNHPNAGD